MLHQDDFPNTRLGTQVLSEPLGPDVPRLSSASFTKQTSKALQSLSLPSFLNSLGSRQCLSLFLGDFLSVPHLFIQQILAE